MRYQSGFTAVEVLVTLIIAFLLVGGAYQAYNVVLQHTSEASMRSTASNLAYDTLRREAAKVNTTCTVKTNIRHYTFPPNTPLPIDKSMVSNHSCPFGTTSPMTLVTTTVSYESKKVTHAILASRQ